MGWHIFSMLLSECSATERRHHYKSNHLSLVTPLKPLWAINGIGSSLL